MVGGCCCLVVSSLSLLTSNLFCQGGFDWNKCKVNLKLALNRMKIQKNKKANEIKNSRRVRLVSFFSLSLSSDFSSPFSLPSLSSSGRPLRICFAQARRKLRVSRSRLSYATT